MDQTGFKATPNTALPDPILSIHFHPCNEALSVLCGYVGTTTGYGEQIKGYPSGVFQQSSVVGSSTEWQYSIVLIVSWAKLCQ